MSPQKRVWPPVHETPPARAIGDGLYWTGGCVVIPRGNAAIHAHQSAFLVEGEERAAIVDTSYPRYGPRVLQDIADLGLEEQLEILLPTHSELPHAGNLRRLLDSFPRSRVYGDTRDLHLYMPEHEHRLSPVPVGTSFDLGGRTLTVVEAVIRDLATTVWAHDSLTGTMFVADGFAFSHHHGEGQCRLLAEELPELPRQEDAKLVNEAALYWSRFCDLRPTFDRLDRLFERFPVRQVAPAHGNVISQPDEVLPILREYLLDQDPVRG